MLFEFIHKNSKVFYLSFSRLNIVLNSYDLIKEAFLKRSDEFSDRFLPGAIEFADYKSGKSKPTSQITKSGLSRLFPIGFSITFDHNNPPPFLFQPYFKPLTVMNGRKTNDSQYRLSRTLDLEHNELKKRLSIR